MTDEARFLGIVGLNLGPTGLNQDQNEVFRQFLEFGSLVFLEIACNDTLQQCLTSSNGKTHEKKNWESKFGPKEPKSDPKLVFLSFYHVWLLSFPLKYIR